MATISSPFGRTPRNAGAGAKTYKKGGTTKVAGVMKKGGAPKYQKKSIVDGAMRVGAAAKEAALESGTPRMNPSKIAVPGSSKPATPASRAKFIEMLKTGTPSTPKPKGKAKSGGSMRGKKY